MNISVPAATLFAKDLVVAELLILTDCLGRRTHSLAMALNYLTDIERGNLQLTGDPEVIKDQGARLCGLSHPI